MRCGPRGIWLGLALCGASTVAVAAPGEAFAPFSPYVSLQAEHSSNVFSLPDAEQALIENGDRRLADQSVRAIAGVAVSLPLGLQTLRATVEGRRYDYRHFDRLDHDQYLIAGGIDWELTDRLDGTAEVRQERRLAPFMDRVTTQLTLETDRLAVATVDLDIGSNLRIESGLRVRSLESPLPAFPDFVLDERTADVALKYAFGRGVDTGLYGQYVNGSFNGVPAAGRFDAQSLGLSADYTVDRHSRVASQLGYTLRKDRGASNGRASAVTGKLSYRRQLSGKTVAMLDLFRRVNSYVGDASTVQDTGIGATAEWAPTVKLAVAISYQYGISRFKQSGATGNAANRLDNIHVGSFSVGWQARPWLTMKPYLAYQQRDSSIDRNQFEALVAGVELGIRL